MTTLNARPEAITFAPQQSALIVVDMQNAYASLGGYVDSAGFDISREISSGFFIICLESDLIFGGIVALNISV